MFAGGSRASTFFSDPSLTYLYTTLYTQPILNHMKAFLLLSAFIVTYAFAEAQTYSSSCTPSDSMEIIYRNDACWLANRRTYETNSPYADSITIYEPVIDSIKKALYAFHNMQGAAVTDTLRGIFSHSNFIPGSDSTHITFSGINGEYGLKTITVTINDNTLWGAQWLLGNYTATDNDTVDYLMNRYQLQVSLNDYQVYDDSTIYIVRSPLAINTGALIKQFENISGVAYAYIFNAIGSGNNIKAEFSGDNIQLAFQYGCGDCPSGCNLGRNWKFKVNTGSECPVEYVSVENWGSHIIWITAPCLDYNTTYTLCNGDSTVFFFNGGGSIQWQVSTDGITYNNISDNGNYIGTNTGGLRLHNIPSSWYGNMYTCLSNGVSSKLYYKIKFANNWNGNTDTTWENAANWSCGSLPDNNTDVIIRNGTVFLHTDVTVKSLTVNPGASLIIAPGINLTVLH